MSEETMERFDIPCPNPDCQKKYAPQSWTKSGFKTFLGAPDEKLYCLYCDTRWAPSSEERALLAYLVNASGLAQDVVNEWGRQFHAGNASRLTEEFKGLNEYACRYLEARSRADNHREFSALTEEDAARERSTRQTFAEAYKQYWERVSDSSGERPSSLR